jgi:uncharacterized SAM-binding protein YcdF (DUF218 family)
VYAYLSKFLPLLVLPLGVAIWCSLLALICLRYRKLKTSAAFLAIGLVVLWVAALPVVASKLYRGLESAYPAIPIAEVSAGGCIILLGGVVDAALKPRVEIEMSDAVDRVYKTAALFRAGKAPLVIVTAGNQPWSKSDRHEAELIRDLLVEWGVSPDSILLEGSSRNTRENALYSRNIIQAIGCQRPLLVTSAAHMSRAVAAFAQVGVKVVPVSTDIKIANTRHLTVMDFIPNAGALAMTSDALREWMGQRIYQWQEWN